MGILSGCSQTYGRFTDTAYRYNEYPIAVRYAGGSAALILGPDWIVENFRESSDGAPKGRKMGPRYEVTRGYDTNGDGRVDFDVDEPAWDIRLEHRREDAAIWLESIPMSAKDRDKALSVLARRVQEGMSGAETVVIPEGSAMAGVALSEQRAAVRSVASMPCIVAAHEAWLLELESANVDALTLSPEGRWRRIRIVVIRSGYEHHPRHGTEKFPLFLVVGYSNAPESFASHIPEFEGFLSQIALGNDKDSIPPVAPPHTCHLPEQPAPVSPKADVDAADPPVVAPIAAPSSAAPPVP